MISEIYSVMMHVPTSTLLIYISTVGINCEAGKFNLIGGRQVGQVKPSADVGVDVFLG